jgi:hypothetical protein
MPDKPSYSTAKIERTLARYPQRFAEIALELRNIVLAAAPQATERILADGLGYHNAERGGPVKAGICLISIHEDHVRLSFIHGAFLPDPQGLLQSEEGRKAKRYLTIESYVRAPWEAIEELVRAHADFDPRTIA